MQNMQFREQVMRDQEREIRKRIRDRLPQRRQPSRSVRRAVGRSIIEIGYRISAEPRAAHPQTSHSFRLARPR